MKTKNNRPTEARSAWSLAALAALSTLIFSGCALIFDQALGKEPEIEFDIPQNLRAIPIKASSAGFTAGTIKLIWDPVAGAEFYVVEKNGLEQPPIAAPAASYIDLSPSSPAGYRVKVQGAGAESGWSMTVSAVPNSGGYTVGDYGPGGGIIFYKAGSPQPWGRYLEAAPAVTEQKAPWGLASAAVSTDGASISNNSPNNNPTTIGKGRQNTQAIVDRLSAAGESGRAAQICHGLNINGCGDWFLPSMDELHEMYSEDIRCDMNPDRYWSSSSGGTVTYYLNANDGKWHSTSGSGSNRARSDELRVRAVRYN